MVHTATAFLLLHLLAGDQVSFLDDWVDLLRGVSVEAGFLTL